MKYRYFLNLLFLWPLQLAFATIIYTQTSEDGHLQFSDKPSPGAQIMTLEKINVYSTSTEIGDRMSENSLSTVAYAKLSLVQPQDQQTFQNEQQITVEIFIQPALRKEDSLELWLDGSLYQKSRDIHLSLNHLTRGEHKLQVNIVSSQDKILLQSSPVLFFVHYATIE